MPNQDEATTHTAPQGTNERENDQDFKEDFKEGDVETSITNGYRMVRGTKGTVTLVTKTQVTLLDKTGKSYRRKYTN